MSRKRTIVIDGELCDAIEEKYKIHGRTWNDVMSYLYGYYDFKEFCDKNSVIKNTKKCKDTIDMFGEENGC
ncbi:TPA: hypothetical protein NNQ18_004578 [Salmonella enterica]|nr:hypothetical protein [Salmonella enterica]